MTHYTHRTIDHYMIRSNKTSSEQNDKTENGRCIIKKKNKKRRAYDCEAF